MFSRQESMMINIAQQTQELIIMKEDLKMMKAEPILFRIRKSLKLLLSLKYQKAKRNWKKGLLVWKIIIYIVIWTHVCNVYYQLMSYEIIICQNSFRNLIIWGLYQTLLNIQKWCLIFFKKYFSIMQNLNLS